MIKVLLIDDEPDLCEVVKGYLSRSGEFEIATANSVAEAREAMACADFDVIVSDYQMPLEDGLQLLKSLRSAGNNIPFILFTGKGREEVVIEAINSGADFYLQKGGKLAPMYSELAHKIRAAARRHGAEASLRQSESMYRALFDRSVDPIALIDEDGRIMSANAAAAAMLGIEAKKLVGMHPREFSAFQKKSIDDFLAAIATARENGNAERVFRAQFAPGHTRWIELYLSSVNIGSGRKVTQIIVRDITAHRQEKKTRDDVLRLHRELAANIPGIVYRLWLAPERKIIFFNDFLEELTGFSPEELVMGEMGCAVSLALPADRGLISATLKDSIEKCEPFVMEYRIVRKDGRIRYVYESGRPKRGPDGDLYIDGVVFDDSARRMAVLRENVTQSHFQSLFRNTSDMVVYHEMVRDGEGKAVDYRIVGFNDAFCDITGLARGDAEGVLASQAYGQTPPPYIDRYDEVARTGVQMSFDTCYAPLARHFRISVVKVGEDGFATITSDITKDVESKNAIEKARDELEEANQRLAAAEEELRQQVDTLEDGGAALRESEERYRMLVELSNDGVIVHRNGIVTFANQTMADILGYPNAKMLLGTNSLDFLVPSQKEEVAARIMKASYSEQPVLREKLVRRDGSLVTALVSARPLPAMGKGSAMSIVHDITEEEAAHEVVKKLNADLTLQNEINKIMLLESGPDLDIRLLEVILRELDSRVGFIGHVEADHLLEVDAINSGSGCQVPVPRMRFPRSAWGSIWGRCMEECRSKRAACGELRLPDGHIGIETLVCAPLTHLGCALGVIAVADRKGGYGPEEQRKLEAIAAYISPLVATRMEKELADMERQRAEKALAEANRKLQLLTGVTRHDIINQLTFLRGNLALASAENDEVAARHHAEKAMIAADNIESMIRFTKEYEEIGLQAPVWQRLRKAFERAASGIECKGLTIENDLPQAEIWSDPLLVKVFFNLLDNTMRHGGGASRVRLSAFESEGQLHVIYQDDGDGILPQDKQRLFERGFGKNTGYGLFFAREILEMTGISILEEGAAGEGARFLIRVPEGCWRPARAP